jgi:two-component system response regulator AtoC
MKKHTVLVVDDEIKMQRILELMLQDMGHEARRADNGEQALQIIARESVDLIITDMRMPVMDGMALLQTLHEQDINIPAIMITAHGTVKSAVEAMKFGAVDYILRPFEIETVEMAVNKSLSAEQIQRENRFLRDELEYGWQEFTGRSDVMQTLYRLIEQVGPSPSPALITGETGTGKELVAHAIHHASGRQGLFVAINCAAIPESILESELFGHTRGAFTGADKERVGKFEVADAGTLFLDEITEMPITLQAKLLRVLQENTVERLGSNRRIHLDLRIIATTNRDPHGAIKGQTLREDLYYRLNVFNIPVPPLRERSEDIALLLKHFIQKYAAQIGKKIKQPSEALLQKLYAHTWPGNIRELQNLTERAVVLCNGNDFEQILLRDLQAVSNSTDSA